MKNIRLVFILSLLSQFAFSQYITPGTGVIWDLDDLVNNSDGVITIDEGIYYIHDDLTISETDTIQIISDEIIKIEFEKLITVLGIFQAQPPQELYITAIDTTQNFKGFKFDESGASIFKNCLIEFGGGIDISYSDMLIEDCVIRKNDKSNSTGVIDLFHSNPEILNCEIFLNQGPAVLSSATGESSPLISGNYIYHNNTTNQNMPQINLGTSDVEKEIQIINNYIEGNYNMAGGIAVTTLAGGNIECLIKGNTIINNRYGITVYGYNITSVIDSNLIQDNNIQNLPMQGGSGINLWGDVSNNSMISRNTITGNLWGITNTGNAFPNIGQVDPFIVNIGENFIYNNGNDGEIYDLYNNTPNDIFAENNYWGTYDLDTIEMHIFHEPDDPSLGFVDYLPIKEDITGYDNKTNPNKSIFYIYPNPAREKIFMKFISEPDENQEILIQIYNLSGQEVLLFNKDSKYNILDISELKNGTYMLKVSTGNFIDFRKLIKY